MDWTKSGRIDSFIFEKIEPNNLSKSLGKLNGVVGGKLSFNYDTDLKISGSLKLVKSDGLVNNCLIRIYYVVKADADAAEEKIELCTCFASTSEMEYENGLWSGTINLRSVLARFIDDQITKNWTIAKGTGALTYFDNIFEWLGGAAIRSGVTNTKYKKNKVYEMGTAPINVLQDIAAYVDGRLTVDTHGRVVLQKYVKPKNKTVTSPLPSGAYSVTLPGLSLEDTTAGTTNRYAVKFTYQNSKNKDVNIFGLAKVDKTSKFHYNTQGRWITQTETLDEMDPWTKDRANEIAKNRLANVAYSYRYWKLKCYYVPITELCLNGGVIKFEYGNLDIDGLVYSVDMDLSVGGMLDVTLRQVRARGTL